MFEFVCDVCGYKRLYENKKEQRCFHPYFDGITNIRCGGILRLKNDPDLNSLWVMDVLYLLLIEHKISPTECWNLTNSIWGW